ncbi:MAG: InlB B-repeat-containing protein [Clostridium sp.]|nr:InlB B-repeat-containing protein [Clostridium sp.]
MMMEYGYLPADTYDNYGYLFYKQESGLATKFNTKDWSLEFSYIVADDAEGSAQFFAPEKCFTDPDDDYSWDNPIIIGKVSDEREGQNIAGNYPEFQDSVDWKIQPELYDQDEDSTLTFTNPVKFNAGEGTFANGASEFTTGEGFIGEALSAADQPAAVTAPGGKSFVGWVPSTVDLATATAADCVDVSAIKYNYAVDTYNALYETTAATTFNFTFNPNGGAFADASTEAKTVTVNEGEAVNAPVPTRVGYEFKGWALSTVENPTVDDVQALPEAASADMSYKAVWSKNSYNVKWIVDGVTVKEESVAYGDELPAAPSVDAKAGYNFAWSSAPATMPAADVEITGAYTPIVYTVTWKIDGEQGTYKQTQATFGEAIATPEAPIEKEGYTFEWRGIPETMPADENLVITGYYVANSYKVTWTVDGKEFTTTTVKYGDAIIAPDYTAEAGYDFAWDEIPATMPANDITINGTTTAKTYTVTWNVNGEKVGETTVKFGDAIADYAFDAPEGYEFSGWTDKPATMPASDITVNGTTTAKSYTVTWNVNGEKVGETTVKFGDAIADYEYAAPAGCNFSGWTDKPETMPASNITVNGTTTAKTYTVTWKVDGEVVGTTTETFGQPIADYNYQAPVGSTFGGWLDKPETMPDNENLVINGTLRADIHTITWKVNGEVIATTNAVYGAEIADYDYTAPTGYTFSGWTDKPATMPANNIEVNGTTTIKTYTVKWTINGEYYNSTEVKYGEAVTAPQYTIPAGHSFAWGDIPSAMPDDDNLVINGTLTINRYTITYYYDEAETQVYFTETLDYGTAPTAKEAPTLKGKRFVDWDSDVPAALTQDVKLHALFTDIEYTVIFKGPEGNLLDWTVTYEDAIDAITEADAAVEGYTFTGVWNYNGAAVTFPTTVKALTGDDDKAATEFVFEGVYNINIYHIVFYKSEADKANGIVLHEQDYEFNTDISNAVADPTMEGHTFLGWDHEPAIVESNDEFIGQWDINTYKVTWNVNGAKVGETEVKYGEAIADFEYTAPEGYTFSGWTDKPETMPASNITVNGTTVANTYKVTWNVNGAKVGETEVKYGEAIADFEYTAPAGYTFGGWTDKPDTMPANDIVVNGTTVANGYKVVWKVNGEKVGETVVSYGDAIADYDYTAPEGYEFSGWTDKPETMPANEIVVNGTTTPKTYTVTWKVGDDFTTTTEVKYGEALAAPAYTPAAGYDFEWVDVPATMPANDALVISGKLTAKTYTVTWKVNGEIVGTTTETFGEAIADYAYTAPTGYTFSGWTDKPDTMPADDALVINGTNIANKYTVKFVDADGAEISSGEFEFGSDITAPSITVPDGMTLVGWVDGDGEAFTGKVPAKNVTYKPNIVSNDNVPYAIEIYLENVDGVYELSGSTSLTGTTGQSVSAVAGEVSGFTFNAAESTLTAIIAGDGSTKLVLKYSRNVYTATFDGVEYTVRYGAALPDVTPADKTGMEFVGWVDAQGNKAPATMPANDLALTSKWEAIEYTITYIVNGQKTVETYKYGDTVIAPADPVVDKMTFTGWSMEIPTTMPAENLIIIASFESTGTVDAYTVTFWADGVEFQKTLVKVGSEITLPTNSPTKEFYVFKGWKDVPAAMPANDIDIYAEFERVPVTLIPKAGSTTVIDRDNMVIYGLQERMSEATYNTYLDVEGDGHFTVTATANGFGTGTVIELYDNVTGQLLETYYVVIFGDLNGDSRVNATDVSLANDEVLSVTGWSLKQVYSNGVLVDNPDYKVYMTMAADLNGDGRIDSIDTSIISNRALALTYIDQVTGRATEA